MASSDPPAEFTYGNYREVLPLDTTTPERNAKLSVRKIPYDYLPLDPIVRGDYNGEDQSRRDISLDSANYDLEDLQSSPPIRSSYNREAIEKWAMDGVAKGFNAQAQEKTDGSQTPPNEPQREKGIPSDIDEILRENPRITGLVVSNAAVKHGYGSTYFTLQGEIDENGIEQDEIELEKGVTRDGSHIVDESWEAQDNDPSVKDNILDLSEIKESDSYSQKNVSILEEPDITFTRADWAHLLVDVPLPTRPSRTGSQTKQKKDSVPLFSQRRDDNNQVPSTPVRNTPQEVPLAPTKPKRTTAARSAALTQSPQAATASQAASTKYLHPHGHVDRDARRSQALSPEDRHPDNSRRSRSRGRRPDYKEPEGLNSSDDARQNRLPDNTEASRSRERAEHKERQHRRELGEAPPASARVAEKSVGPSKKQIGDISAGENETYNPEVKLLQFDASSINHSNLCWYYCCRNHSFLGKFLSSAIIRDPFEQNPSIWSPIWDPPGGHQISVGDIGYQDIDGRFHAIFNILDPQEVDRARGLSPQTPAFEKLELNDTKLIVRDVPPMFCTRNASGSPMTAGQPTKFKIDIKANDFTAISVFPDGGSMTSFPITDIRDNYRDYFERNAPLWYQNACERDYRLKKFNGSLFFIAQVMNFRVFGQLVSGQSDGLNGGSFKESVIYKPTGVTQYDYTWQQPTPRKNSPNIHIVSTPVLHQLRQKGAAIEPEARTVAASPVAIWMDDSSWKQHLRKNRLINEQPVPSDQSSSMLGSFLQPMPLGAASRSSLAVSHILNTAGNQEGHLATPTSRKSSFSSRVSAWFSTLAKKFHIPKKRAVSGELEESVKLVDLMVDPNNL